MNKLVIDYTQYRNLVAGICRDISRDSWRPDYVVGITRGGLLAATMISHYFDVPMHTLKVNLRDFNSSMGPESNLWMAEDAFGYQEVKVEDTKKNILVIDDINDTGATMNWIMEDWQKSCLPGSHQVWDKIWNNNVRFAVVVDNMSSRCKVKMDYSGMIVNKAEKDVWVDFPYEDWWTK